MKSSHAFGLVIISTATASAISLAHQADMRKYHHHGANKSHYLSHIKIAKKATAFVAHQDSEPRRYTTAKAVGLAVAKSPAMKRQLVVSAQLKNSAQSIKPLTATMQTMANAHSSIQTNNACSGQKTGATKSKLSAAVANRIAAARLAAYQRASILAARQGRGPLHPVPAAQPVIKTMSANARQAMKQRFINGQAGLYSPTDLISAGVFSYYPIVGGTFRRTSEMKNIVVHSTETGSVADAKMVIRSWNNSGRNHAGAQFIVDRDGTIYETVDPSYGTFHVNSYKTLHDVKNDNSIGIEIVRTGSQQYTPVQFKSVVCLVAYLKNHFQINQVWGHGQVQPSDRTDPCNFNWTAFHKGVDSIDTSQIAARGSGGGGGRASRSVD